MACMVGGTLSIYLALQLIHVDVLCLFCSLLLALSCLSGKKQEWEKGRLSKKLAHIVEARFTTN